jgi:hypothetical protein
MEIGGNGFEAKDIFNQVIGYTYNDIILMPRLPYHDEWKEHAEAEPEYLFIEL